MLVAGSAQMKYLPSVMGELKLVARDATVPEIPPLDDGGSVQRALTPGGMDGGVDSGVALGSLGDDSHQ